MEGKALEVVPSALVPGETLEPLVMAALRFHNPFAASNTSGVDGVPERYYVVQCGKEMPMKMLREPVLTGPHWPLESMNFPV